jgi:hypothetical protein
VAPQIIKKIEAKREQDERNRPTPADIKKAEATRKKHEAEIKKAEAALERARRNMAEAEAALKAKKER